MLSVRWSRGRAWYLRYNERILLPWLLVGDSFKHSRQGIRQVKGEDELD